MKRLVGGDRGTKREPRSVGGRGRGAGPGLSFAGASPRCSNATPEAGHYDLTGKPVTMGL